jgi:Alpha/beta-hydrolase family
VTWRPCRCSTQPCLAGCRCSSTRAARRRTPRPSSPTCAWSSTDAGRLATRALRLRREPGGVLHRQHQRRGHVDHDRRRAAHRPAEFRRDLAEGRRLPGPRFTRREAVLRRGRPGASRRHGPRPHRSDPDVQTDNPIIYLVHPSDPIGAWPADHAAWLDPRGPDVSPDVRAWPVVSGWQATFDQFNANGVPPGHGHVHDETVVTAWSEIVGPPTLPAAEVDVIRAAIADLPALAVWCPCRAPVTRGGAGGGPRWRRPRRRRPSRSRPCPWTPRPPSGRYPTASLAPDRRRRVGAGR